MNIENSYQRSIQSNNLELEKSYPEIYKIVYPMILKTCEDTRGNITNDVIESMTEKIYSSLEEREVRNQEALLENNSNNRNINKVSENQTKETRETRQMNRELRDLIKILLIRELLGRPGIVRPPRPPRPRPPHQSRPPMRTPYMMRDFETNNYDLYEN